MSINSASPSIKGSVVKGHAEMLGKHLADGTISEESLARHFGPDEIAVLRGPFEDTGWYDVGLYCRLLEFVRDQIGGGSNEYLVEAGARTASRLIETGIHQQMEYLQRTQHRTREDKEARSAAFGRDLRLLNSISGSIMNFSVSEVVPDPDYPLRWMIQKIDARDYHEPLCWTTLGFVNRMATDDGDPDLWYWERLSEDVVRFRMRRDVCAAPRPASDRGRRLAPRATHQPVPGDPLRAYGRSWNRPAKARRGRSALVTRPPYGASLAAYGPVSHLSKETLTLQALSDVDSPLIRTIRIRWPTRHW